MKTLFLAMAMLVPEMLPASTAIQNLTFPAGLGSYAGGQNVIGTVEVTSAPWTTCLVAIAIDDASASAPTASSFWVVGDSTPPASTPIHSCPTGGYPVDPPQGATQGWRTLNISFWMPYGFINCAAKKLFVIASNNSIGMGDCAYEAIAVLPFIYNTAAGCATATSTPTRTPTNTPVWTPTSGGATPTPIPTATAIPTAMATAVPTTTTVTLKLPKGNGVDTIVVSAFPNPNPSNLAFRSNQDYDQIWVRVYSVAGTLLRANSYIMTPTGSWGMAPMPTDLPNGSYHARVLLFSKGALVGRGGAVVLITH